MAIILPILGLSRWNKNWNIRNSYSYVATATKIRFHFQFPRSPDATFGGLIGWLFNWKCKFSCRIISNIANNLKCNYLLDGVGIDNVTLRLWKFSDFCSRHTAGFTGYDIMFHILVLCIVIYGVFTASWAEMSNGGPNPHQFCWNLVHDFLLACIIGE